MANDTHNARDRLIETASRLFQQQGYQATGLNQILEVSHAPKGSLYYYFPKGKEELGSHAVEAAADAICAAIQSDLDRHDDPAEGIIEVINTMIRALRQDGELSNSSLGVIALETWNSNESLNSACSKAFDRLEQVFGDAMKRGGIPDDAANRLGMTSQALIEGSIMLSLTQHDTTALENAKQALTGLIAMERKTSRE